MDTTKQASPLVLPANTPAWTFQVWAAFVLSVLIITRGIYLADVQAWARGFMMIAILFTTGSSFTLSKTLRDNRDTNFDTPAWMFFAWASFLAAVIATVTGIYWLPAAMLPATAASGLSSWVQGFFLAAFLFQINASFSLSKTVRDNFEANKRLNGG